MGDAVQDPARTVYSPPVATTTAPSSPSRRGPTLVRGLWLGAGLAGCGLGFVGIALPGMPATVFFILAAFCFSKSSDRLLNWVLGLPKVGPMVRDYRAGLGMPRAAKLAALTLMLGFGTVSLMVLSQTWLRVATLGLLATGAWVVWRGVPTREQVLARARVPR